MQTRKQLILIMNQQYPFGQYEQLAPHPVDPHANILVRKIHQTMNIHNRNQILEKVNMIREIRIPSLISIETILEEETSLHLLYEYVPSKLSDIIDQLNLHSLLEIKNCVLKLGMQLGLSGIWVDWSIESIGLTKNFQCKYYLDINKMHVNKKYNMKAIQNNHAEKINQLFENYLNIHEIEKAQPKQPPRRQQFKAKNIEKKSMKRSTNHWKEIQQDQQILRDFINVLDDKSQPSAHNGSEEEQVIWLESNQQHFQKQPSTHIDSQQIRQRANEAIQRSIKAIKTFRQVILRKKQ